MTKPTKLKETAQSDNTNTSDQDSDNNDNGNLSYVDNGQEPPTPRQQRGTKRLFSTDNHQGLNQPPKMSSSPAPTTINSPKTGTTKKSTPRSNAWDLESDDDAMSVRSARTDSSDRGKTFLTREAKQKMNPHSEHECNNIRDIEKLCDRLSLSKKTAIIEYIQSILERNEQMAELLQKFHNDLSKQEEINNRLSRRLDAI